MTIISSSEGHKLMTFGNIRYPANLRFNQRVSVQIVLLVLVRNWEEMYTCCRVPGLPACNSSPSSSTAFSVPHLQRASAPKWRRSSRSAAAVVSVRSSASEPPKFDVSSNCVTPVFRVSPFVQKAEDLENPKVRVLFVSEGNVCRSVYAEAIFNALIDEHGMHEFVECASKASRDYNMGESPDARAVAVADELGLKLPEGAAARVFECQSDIVLFDLLVVMDKFNASDVLKEVTVYEAIDKEARYTHKVRRLAEFCRTKKMEDIDDPLYGNMGGPEELELLREVYQDIRASCVGLIQTIMDIKTGLQGSETLKQGVGSSLGAMESLDWLVPPMLQKAETQRR